MFVHDPNVLSAIIWHSNWTMFTLMMTQSISANHAHNAGHPAASSSRSPLANCQLIIMHIARTAFAPEMGSGLLMGGKGSGFVSLARVVTGSMVSFLSAE